MLLEFRCSNYKSFKDEFVFSMKPHVLQKGLDYSIQKTTIGKKEYKSLSSTVIYGPNASGKTNIIEAIETLKKIITRGHINNVEENIPNYAACTLELIPNYISTAPTSFSIEFINDNYLFNYSIEIDLGAFLIPDAERKIISEKLFVNEKPVFKRETDRIDVFKVPDFYNETVVSFFDNAIDISNSSLKDTELFLSNGLKNIFNPTFFASFIEWFYIKLETIVRADSINSIPVASALANERLYVDQNLNRALAEFGVINSSVGYTNDKDGKPIVLSLIGKEKATRAIPSEVFESYGTIRFINEFPIIMKTFSEGGILIIDEFDASIHPMALMSIINVFHNDELNKKHAQLVFNTHNPIFLDHTLFRRDEIKFVEYDKDQMTSVLYSLSDFNTSETSGTRKNSDYMKNYFVNRYGAITNVDFSSVFEAIMKNSSEDKTNEG